MAYDIHGNQLQMGNCEVHPYVGVPYPCPLCFAEQQPEPEQPAPTSADLIAAAEQRGAARVAAAVEAVLAHRCGGAAEVYLNSVEQRWRRTDAPSDMQTECGCDESPHLNALHDLAVDDVPRLLEAARRALAAALAPEATDG